jgi:hypothetical protein
MAREVDMLGHRPGRPEQRRTHRPLDAILGRSKHAMEAPALNGETTSGFEVGSVGAVRCGVAWTQGCCGQLGGCVQMEKAG